ncbi:3-deoxy-D-manno-octulosonic acid transferase [Frigidibacter sp. RF13]|uniref:3-deoxy-D-manno-octulosonic acid transferase n=1 Tax=Frigidibacter sp. RF13 TaxID=2997340 RepID=UPI0022720CEA|nr:glycosyltransferase N-terminal domain-containing protein [Frigidibacter sp. RF13]MCY1126283.1 3-deoxy-D-manno-octulosonic acid transferase [Frigidibacter sp. RF13]
MVIYRILSSLAFLWLRATRGAAERERVTAPEACEGPVVWLHGASNGEMQAARGVVARLRTRWPELRLMITVNSLTAREMVRGWGLEACDVRLAPVDHLPLVRAFLDRVRPVALVMIENELWPHRLSECAARGVPVLVLGGRMSARSARIWGWMPGLARRVIGPISWLAPQDEAARARFLGLGLPDARLGPVTVLKAAAVAGAAPVAGFDRVRTILAASTHEGEEAAVLEAFASVLPRHPGARLILAPRHPRRRDEVEAEIAARGLSFATRSRGGAPEGDAPVYLADTMGEMDLWYGAAGICFVGGSLAPRGGHTPFEPAAHGAAILHGPSLENFAPAYAALATSGGAVAVGGAADLEREFDRLLGDGAGQAALADAGGRALAAFGAEAGLAAFEGEFARLTGLKAGPDAAEK